MSEAVHVDPGSLLSKHRIEALSDGVFAVVMTLLVLEIKPDMEPQAGDEAVRHMLRALALPFLTFAFAFLISCIVWSLHHRKFALLRHTNPVHTGLTLAFLFPVTLLPVSVSIFLHARSSYAAEAVYLGNFTLIIFLLLLSWLYARHFGLVDPAQPADTVRRLTRRMIVLTAFGVLATTSCYLNLPYLLLFSVPIFMYLRFRKETSAAS